MSFYVAAFKEGSTITEGFSTLAQAEDAAEDYAFKGYNAFVQDADGRTISEYDPCSEKLK